MTSPLRPGGAALAAAVLVGCLWHGPEETARPAPDPAARRTLASGPVVGFATPAGSHAWLGIPYARPPVGALRWRAPQPPSPWGGVRPAVAPGSPCPQYPSAFGGVPGRRHTVVGREDCLFLNVWAPRFERGAIPDGSERLPVMLWIHGGGNVIGHGAFYDGGLLAARHQVLVVTVNYRLGPLGWFRHAALADEQASDLDRSGNYGLLDLVAVLDWVRRNAAVFGGDPNNVTIFGESAGGRNVVSLLLSPQARGLFHRAIVQSGGTRSASLAQAENFSDDPEPGDAASSREVLLRLLQQDGARDRAEARSRLAAMSPSDVARYLRAKSPQALLAVYTSEPREGLIRVPNPIADGVVLPIEAPVERFGRPGGYHAVPTLLGTTRDEAKLFFFFDAARVRRWFGVVPRVRDPVRYELSAEYHSRLWKADGADELAEHMSRVQGPTVWVYRFDWDEEPRVLGADLGRLLGAAHGFEIPFVFGHFDLGRAGRRLFTETNRPGREALSESMMSYWAQFAWNGDPGTGRDGRLPPWPAWREGNPGTPRFLVLDTPQDGGIRTASGAESVSGLVAELLADPRLPTREARCELLAELADASHRLAESDLREAGCD